MKKANTILSHLLHLPQFKSLKSHYCYQKFISLLSPRFQKAIAFVYIRQATLFIAVSHPGFKMELNYNKDLFKSLLSILSKQDSKCQNMMADKIVIFNSKYHSIIKEESKEETIPYYQEMSEGEFSIKSKDRELVEAFSKIRALIEQKL